MISLNLRLPEELHKAIKALANKERRSLNAQILFMLEEYLRRLRETDKQSQ
jgi:hypothetical protein